MAFSLAGLSSRLPRRLPFSWSTALLSGLVTFPMRLRFWLRLWCGCSRSLRWATFLISLSSRLNWTSRRLSARDLFLMSSLRLLPWLLLRPWLWLSLWLRLILRHHSTLLASRLLDPHWTRSCSFLRRPNISYLSATSCSSRRILDTFWSSLRHCYSLALRLPSSIAALFSRLNCLLFALRHVCSTDRRWIRYRRTRRRSRRSTSSIAAILRSALVLNSEFLTARLVWRRANSQ